MNSGLPVRGFDFQLNLDFHKVASRKSRLRGLPGRSGINPDTKVKVIVELKSGVLTVAIITASEMGIVSDVASSLQVAQ